MEQSTLKNRMIPVVISGGSGTRLWPVSRSNWPKQFCNLFDESLQTLTMRRVAKFGEPWVLTTESLRNLTEKKFKELAMNSKNSLYEPQPKNTAPAIATLCRVFELQGKKDSVVGVFPADQLIEKEPEFFAAVEMAIQDAEQGRIVTLGITPTFAATGFGYIQTEISKSTASCKVLKFHEKPNEETAKEFLQSKNYFWNAGIFIFKVQSMIQAFKDSAPDIWAVAEKLKSDQSNLAEIYQEFKSISIDYAVIEKLSENDLRCVPCDMGWSDVGSWDAMADIQKTNPAQQCKVEIDSKNNYLHPLTGKVYAFVGADDLVVVDTRDALLISKKGQTQEVKNIVEKLKQEQPKFVVEGLFEERPWGRFEVLKNSKKFKSKVIHIEPGAQLSYQSHTRREEHWVMIEGKGEVLLNDEVIPVQAGMHIKIPLGAKHRIRNTGNVLLEFVEVQTGTYFGEDDIVRYQDDYNRK